MDAQGTNEINTNTAVVETTTSTDNSSNANFSEDEISKALDEPVTPEEESTQPTQGTEPPKTDEPKDNTPDECPDKFKNQDGSVNIANLLKSYKELESNSSKKETEWQKERADLLKVKEDYDKLTESQIQYAKNSGYDSVEDMQQVYEIAALEANEYAKYLQYTEDPEAVRKMLIDYMNNPRPELMEDIEVEFAPEINKRVAIASDRQKQAYEAQKEQQANTVKMANIENVISQSVDANKELFNYEPFKKLFVNALQTYGDKFTFEDAKVLMDTMVELKEAFRTEFEKQSGTKIANDQAIDKIASINTQTTISAPAASQLTNSDISKMSDEELAKAIGKLI